MKTWDRHQKRGAYKHTTSKRIARFHERYRVVESGCWEWTHRKDGKGYGRVGWPPFTFAHRFSYAAFVGPLDDLCVLHRCDNPSCVNPDHLFLGTREDNVADMLAKGRTARGETFVNSKLTAKQVIELRQRGEAGHSPRLLAETFGVTRENIYAILKRKTWAHLEAG